MKMDENAVLPGNGSDRLTDGDVIRVTGGAFGERGEKEIRKKIADRISGIIGLDLPTGNDVALDDLGLDSLDIVDIVSRVENEFHIQIPKAEFGRRLFLKTLTDQVAELLK